MNKKDFIAILQVALLRNDDLSELKIRQLFVGIGSNEIIQEGIELHNKLNSIELKNED